MSSDLILTYKRFIGLIVKHKGLLGNSDKLEIELLVHNNLVKVEYGTRAVDKNRLFKA